MFPHVPINMAGKEVPGKLIACLIVAHKRMIKFPSRSLIVLPSTHETQSLLSNNLNFLPDVELWILS